VKTYKLIIGGQRYEASVLEYTPSHAKIKINGTDYYIQIEDDTQSKIPVLPQQEKAVPLAAAFSSGYSSDTGEIRAPLPGVISRIPVKEGDKVKKGQTILVLEAMKMESEIATPVDCVIGSIHVQERAPVHEGDLLMTLEDVETPKRTSARSSRKKPAPQPAPVTRDDNIVRAPLSGTIIDLKAGIGDSIERGQVLLILEAMKMESEIHSPLGGKIAKIHVQKGASVQEGDPLVEMEA